MFVILRFKHLLHSAFWAAEPKYVLLHLDYGPLQFPQLPVYIKKCVTVIECYTSMYPILQSIKLRVVHYNQMATGWHYCLSDIQVTAWLPVLDPETMHGLLGLRLSQGPPTHALLHGLPLTRYRYRFCPAPEPIWFGCTHPVSLFFKLVCTNEDWP